MIEPWQALIRVCESNGAGILHSLLGVDRSVRAAAHGRPDERPVGEANLRVVHRSLRGLTGYLPASNGVVIVGALTGPIWQGATTGWGWCALLVLGWWPALQTRILTRRASYRPCAKGRSEPGIPTFQPLQLARLADIEPAEPGPSMPRHAAPPIPCRRRTQVHRGGGRRHPRPLLPQGPRSPAPRRTRPSPSIPSAGHTPAIREEEPKAQVTKGLDGSACQSIQEIVLVCASKGSFRPPPSGTQPTTWKRGAHLTLRSSACNGSAT